MEWRRFFRRSRLDDEVTRDLQFYLDTETEDNVARGMTPTAARDAALRKLGNPGYLREEVYRMNTASRVESIWQDLRYASRVLRKSRAFTVTAIVSLALGIGGNTAVFTVLRGVVLKPLPYPESDRLVKVAEAEPDSPRPETVDFTTTADWRARSRSFETLSLYRDTSGAIVESGQPELLQGTMVNYDYFRTLGVKMLHGREFLPEEDRPDRRFEVILTYGLWMRRFGGDPHILGRSLRMNDSSFTVVGVLPAGFRPLNRIDSTTPPDFYKPLGYALDIPAAGRGNQHLQLIGRLRRGVSVDQARSELNAVMAGIIQEHPKEYHKDARVRIEPLQGYLVAGVRTALWVLFGAVGLVLLIACANVANLALARAAGREKEMSLRAAVGANRRRLVRQLILESALLATVSGAAGLLLAWLATSALISFSSRQLPRVNSIGLDAPVLWFTVLVSLATVVLSGIPPALRTSRVNLADTLKGAGRSTESQSRHLFSNALVMGELALAFLLVMGAGLLAKSFIRLTGVDLGYDPRNVMTFGVYVYSNRYAKPEAELNYYAQVMDRLRAIPGVESAGMTSLLPMGSFDRRGFHIQDRPLANTADAPSADTYSVSPDYFRVMKIPLKRGRYFTEADHQGTPGVALISEECARMQFAGRDAIGQHIQVGGRSEKKEWLTIVGVVGDVRQYGFDHPPNIAAYLAQAQNVSFGYNMVVRTSGDPARLENAMRAAFLAVDATQPVYQVRPLEDYVSDSLATRSMTLSLLGVFGVLALTLAAVGVYGVMAYTVSQRTGEFGIRMALGAGQLDVLMMVLRQGVALAAGGIVTGAAASLALTRFLAMLLYDVRPNDSVTLAVSALGLAAVATLAAFLPARRSTRIDPMVALRAE